MSAKKPADQKAKPRTISISDEMWNKIGEISGGDRHRSEWIKKWIKFGIEDHEENEALASSPVFQRIVADAKKIGSDS